MPVHVALRPEDMPGRPLSRVACGKCGEHVQDGREVRRDSAVLCRSCAGSGYFTLVKTSFCEERYAKKT
jgi:formylmethanofuran dehydrogenase subunit E